MKLILGDNQFFGINHADLDKALKTKEIFMNEDSINSFIKQALKCGMHGFMINSNRIGYNIVNNFSFNHEIHYSLPYPHKYASIVNEKGLLSLLNYFFSKTSLIKILMCIPRFIFTGNLKYLLPIATSLEIPKNLPKGSTVYLQNILTDLLIGINRLDILEYFVIDIRKKGYKPGIITLNPLMISEKIFSSEILNQNDLILCFNINKSGFNVFPNLEDVEKLISKNKRFKLMAMSIFSSGASDIKTSIDYIKKLNLDYVVFGSSKIKNIKNNLENFKK